MARQNQVFYMNSKINIIDGNILGMHGNCYQKIISFEYIDAYVIMCGQVFTLQKVSLPNRPCDDKTPRTIETQ